MDEVSSNAYYAYPTFVLPVDYLQYECGLWVITELVFNVSNLICDQLFCRFVGEN